MGTDRSLLARDSWTREFGRRRGGGTIRARRRIVARLLDDGYPVADVMVYCNRSVYGPGGGAQEILLGRRTGMDGVAIVDWLLPLQPEHEGYGVAPDEYAGPWEQISGPQPPVRPQGEVAITWERIQ